MKKILALLLSVVMLLSLTACPWDKDDAEESPEPTESQNTGVGGNGGMVIFQPGRNQADVPMGADGIYGYGGYDNSTTINVLRLAAIWDDDFHGAPEVKGTGDWQTYRVRSVEGIDGNYYPLICFKESATSFYNATMSVDGSGVAQFCWGQEPDMPIVYFSCTVKKDNPNQFINTEHNGTVYKAGDVYLIIMDYAVYGTFTYTYADGMVMRAEFSCLTEDMEYGLRAADIVAQQYGLPAISAVVEPGNKEVR